MAKIDIMAPGAALLCKLGSIVVHAEEAVSPMGHPLDVLVLKGLLNDPDVKRWLGEMHRQALVPVLRLSPDVRLAKRHA